MTMIVVFPYSLKDQEQALRCAKWILELEGPEGLADHRVLIVKDHRVERRTADEIFHALDYVFGNVEVLEVTTDAWDHWPESCNHMFGLAARHIGDSAQSGPWLWLEADAILLKKGAIDLLGAAYDKAVAEGKVFLGDRVDVENVPVHMSGVGVYPARLIEHAGTALISQEVAWDVSAAHQIVPMMQETKLIEHSWKHPTFENWETVEREVDLENAVLFHSSKDGSLIERLREHNLPVPVLAVADEAMARKSGKADSVVAAHGEARESTQSVNLSDGDKPKDSRGGQFIWDTRYGINTCDILIKTYPKDYEWLNYCLSGLQKFATGFRQVIVIYPSGEPVPFVVSGPIPVQLRPVQENGSGYLFQQAIKFSAHEWTDAPFILHIDSDTVPCASFTPATFFRDGLPIWLMTPYKDIETPWQAPTEKFLREPVKFEFMRRFPMLLPRALHEAAAMECRMQHHKSASEYIVSQDTFSEFNALGAFAFYRGMKAAFAWVDTTKEPLPPLVAIQSWSHGGLTDELRQQFETILGGGSDGHAAVEASTTPAPAETGPSVQDSDILTSPEVQQETLDVIDGIHQTKEGWWVLDNDTHISKWVENEFRLDHDQWGLTKILPEINQGDTVVDAGAFIGDHSVAYLKAVGEKGNVICFEPHPLAFECLARNMFLARVTGEYVVHDRALSDKNGSYFLEVNPNAGASTIVPPESESKNCTVIKAVTLDSFNLQRLDFFKIDVEGHELKVLQGAEQTVARCRPKLLIELNKWALIKQGTSALEIFNWLKAHGYKWSSVQPLNIADPPQYDILCRPLTREEKIKRQVPWESPLASEEEIRKLVTRLKEFCQGHATTRFVRQELALQYVIDKMPGHSWSILRKKRNARKRRLAKHGQGDPVTPLTPEQEEARRKLSIKKKEYMVKWTARKKAEKEQAAREAGR